MHLYFITRGIKHHADMLINDLQAQFYPLIMTDPKTKKQKIEYVQGALRPIQLWEYVFPESQYSVVAKTLNLDSPDLPELSKAQKMILRKAIGNGVTKFPEIDPKAVPRLVRKDWVTIHPIGVKYDEYGQVRPQDVDSPEHEKL